MSDLAGRVLHLDPQDCVAIAEGKLNLVGTMVPGGFSMQDLSVIYPNCHPRTLWYLREIAYCLETYFGYSTEAAAEEVVTSARLLGLAGGSSERVLWHLLPLDWAHKVAKDRDPSVPFVSEDVARQYQATRFLVTPPRKS